MIIIDFNRRRRLVAIRKLFKRIASSFINSVLQKNKVIGIAGKARRRNLHVNRIVKRTLRGHPFNIIVRESEARRRTRPLEIIRSEG